MGKARRRGEEDGGDSCRGRRALLDRGATPTARIWPPTSLDLSIPRCTMGWKILKVPPDWGLHWCELSQVDGSPPLQFAFPHRDKEASGCPPWVPRQGSASMGLSVGA